MIDFTKSVEVFNMYKGSEVKKTLLYNGKRYLVKFPEPVLDKNKNISYINNAFSEYVGSNIFKITGFEVQNTILGTYKSNNKIKIVCACEDFCDETHVLYEFENLAISSSTEKKIGTELSDIMEVIDNNKMKIDKIKFKEYFWNMFIIDSLIGNTDRHNGNFGFLIDVTNNNITNAPIYDCGSCLSPMLVDNDISKLSDSEIKNIAVNIYSAIKINDKRINCFSFISSTCNNECNDAVKRIFNNIDILKIEEFINNSEGMSLVRKKFYINLIKIRYEIIKDTYNKIVS
jgi:hypothetical protein